MLEPSAQLPSRAFGSLLFTPVQSGCCISALRSNNFTTGPPVQSGCCVSALRSTTGGARRLPCLHRAGFSAGAAHQLRDSRCFLHCGSRGGATPLARGGAASQHDLPPRGAVHQPNPLVALGLLSTPWVLRVSTILSSIPHACCLSAVPHHVSARRWNSMSSFSLHGLVETAAAPRKQRLHPFAVTNQPRIVGWSGPNRTGW